MLKLLRKIKRLKLKELKLLAKKLDAIKSKNAQEAKKHKEREGDNYDFWYIRNKMHINEEDIEEALTYCLFHFTGNMLESFGYEVCPCNCYCINCEMVPVTQVYMRMQDIAKDMGEDNVMNEFLDKYGINISKKAPKDELWKMFPQISQ